MKVAKLESRFDTVADLIRELGVPARRIRMTPLPGTAKERDLIRINDRKEGLCELIDGVLVEKALGFREAILAAALIGILDPFVRSRRLGILVGADGPHRLRRGLVRLPDVSFVSWDQLPDLEVPEESVVDLYPDLAVEIFSKGNRRKEMARKRREYFRAGTRLVWIVYPKVQMVEVYTSPTDSVALGVADMLDGGDVLPGFRISIRRLFTPPPAPDRGAKSSNGKNK